jgi:uncharacterized protein (UPF0332 family)
LTGRTLDDLRHQAVADRFKLARHFVDAGDKLLRARPSQSRSAISRYYYGMYHAMRAVVYYVEKGDDHERHTALPKKTPLDFDNRGMWLNNLKDARERRNEADYVPYPLPSKSFRVTAVALQQNAHDLLRLSSAYLISKGCSHL